MQDRLLRRREVEKITGMSRSSIYRLDAGERFSKAREGGSRRRQVEVERHHGWIESRPVARSEFS